MQWLRTKYLVRSNSSTVMEGVRSDGVHIGFAHNKVINRTEARALLDPQLSVSAPMQGRDVNMYKGQPGWVEEPEVQ